MRAAPGGETRPLGSRAAPEFCRLSVSVDPKPRLEIPTGGGWCGGWASSCCGRRWLHTGLPGNIRVGFGLGFGWLYRYFSLVVLWVAAGWPMACFSIFSGRQSSGGRFAWLHKVSAQLGW